MSFSSNVAQQREKEEKVVSSFLVLSFISSAVLHIAILTFCSLWFKTPKLAEKPIEVILVDQPSTPKAVKIKQNTPPIDKPVAVKHTTPKFKTITKSLLTSGAAIRAIAIGGTSGSGTNGTPSKLLSNPDASIPSVKQNTTDSTQSQPVKTASQPKSIVALNPKLNLPPLDPIPPLPKIAETQPPLATLKPTPIPPLPKIAETLPPLPSREPTQLSPSPTVAKTQPPLAKLKPTPILPFPTVAETQPPLAKLKPTPILPFPTVAETLPPLPISQPTQTPLLKPTSTPKVVQTRRLRLSSKPTPTETPTPAFTPSKSSTATPKLTSSSSGLPFPTAPSVAKDNNLSQPENNSSTGSRSNIATALGNRNPGGNGTHDGNGSLPGSGNGSGNTRAIATGNRNGHGNNLGSDGLACRRCPPPNYPSGYEGIEGRAVVEIDVERDGSVRKVEMVQSTGNDNLDQEVVETVEKKWKFVSTDSEQHVQAAVNFAKPGSAFERQARLRVHQAHELQQKRRRERQAQKQQRTERSRLNIENPVTPDTIDTPRQEQPAN